MLGEEGGTYCGYTADSLPACMCFSQAHVSWKKNYIYIPSSKEEGIYKEDIYIYIFHETCACGASV